MNKRVLAVLARLVSADAFFSTPFLSPTTAATIYGKSQLPLLAFARHLHNDDQISSSGPVGSFKNSPGSCNGAGAALFSTAQEIESEMETEATASTKTTESRILADDEKFIKPDLDTRRYRSIILPNNLEALLVSDPETDVEAGAVHIKAGHFDDPAERAGLAHFNVSVSFLIFLYTWI